MSLVQILHEFKTIKSQKNHQHQLHHFHFPLYYTQLSLNFYFPLTIQLLPQKFTHLF